MSPGECPCSWHGDTLRSPECLLIPEGLTSVCSALPAPGCPELEFHAEIPDLSENKRPVSLKENMPRGLRLLIPGVGIVSVLSEAPSDSTMNENQGPVQPG